MTGALAFLAVAALLCAAGGYALLGLGQVALSGAAALERDGLPRGGRAPAWTLADATGRPRTSPPRGPLQLIMFTDHSLRSFPSVADGLRELLAAAPGRDPAPPEIVVLTRGPSAMARAALAELGLAEIPVVAGSPALYARYNVRVMPFAIFVDSGGIVRGSSLVNHDWQLAKLRQVAALPAGPPPTARRRPLRGPAAARAGGPGA